MIDEEPFNSGSLLSADLLLTGVPVLDVDSDGLDDTWELDHFGDLSHSAQEDPDHDGMSNAMEQAVGGDPLTEDLPFSVDLSPWNPFVMRLSWPGTLGTVYQVLASAHPEGPYAPVGVVSGDFPTTEFLIPQDAAKSRLFRIHRVAN